MTVRAILFDWGRTLAPLHDGDNTLAAWQAAARHFSISEVESTAAALDAAEQAYWHAVGINPVGSTVYDIIKAAGVAVHPDVLCEGLESYRQYWERYASVDPVAVPMLTSLRELGVRLGVLSNTLWPRSWHEELFERDGIRDLLDGTTYSSELPWAKPHPKAFEAAILAIGETLDINPWEIVFVGDRLFDDVHGAQQLGMRTVLMPNGHVPAYPAIPDAVIQTLSDLVPVILEWNCR